MLCNNIMLLLVANGDGVGSCRHDKVKEHAEFIIDETFGVPGVGTVIAGTVKRGVITTNANLMLGPDVGDGTFKLTAIKSIQYKRLPVTRVCLMVELILTYLFNRVNCFFDNCPLESKHHGCGCRLQQAQA